MVKGQCGCGAVVFEIDADISEVIVEKRAAADSFEQFLYPYKL